MEWKPSLMPAYLVKTPALFRWLFPACTWRIPNKENKIYLTFDDGPNPELTKKILAVLKKHDVPATFFCIGGQAEKHPELLTDILADNHTLGNHSQSHMNGWQTPTKAYVNDVKICSKFVVSSLFRPPYGKITPKQVRLLKSTYKIIMWDVIGGDFDLSIDSLTIEKNIVENTKSGSIIVLHDNPKFANNMLAVLSSIIVTLKEKGFVFSSIN